MLKNEFKRESRVKLPAYKLISLLCLLGAAGCGRQGLDDTERAERNSKLYRRAFTAEQAGEIDEAVKLYQRVLLDEPRSLSAHFQLATLLQDHKHDYYGAIYHFRTYVALRPDSEKQGLANDRILKAEQLLAPQLLRKLGDSLKDLTQAQLLRQNDELNRELTTLQGEKVKLIEDCERAEHDYERLRGENERLRDLLHAMRGTPTASAELGAENETTAREISRGALRAEVPADEIEGLDPQTIRKMRAEAAALAREGGKTLTPPVDAGGRAPEGARDVRAGTRTPEPVPPVATPGTGRGKQLSVRSLFGREEPSARDNKVPANPRTYVVQPGDTLMRVSQKYYGDATQWKRIRDANRANIDPDGRIRAGQTIIVP